MGLEIDSFSTEALPGPGLIGPVDSAQLDQRIAPQRGGTRVAPLVLDPWTTYDPAVYEKALEHVQALYRSEGYLSARVGPVAPGLTLGSGRTPFCPPGTMLFDFS